MKLFERKVGKKAAVLTGAMILSLAMATAAYAGTADKAIDKSELKFVNSIEATKCVAAEKADFTKIELPKDAVKMTKVDMTDTVGMTKITKVDMTKIDGKDAAPMKAVKLTEAVKTTEAEAKGDVKMTDIDLSGDAKVTEAVAITVMATPAEK